MRRFDTLSKASFATTKHSCHSCGSRNPVVKDGFPITNFGNDKKRGCHVAIASRNDKKGEIATAFGLAMTVMLLSVSIRG